jgi:hypothetical protein
MKADPVGNPKAVGDLFNELGRLLRRDASYDTDLDPLGEFVHRNQYVLVAARGGSEGAHRVKTPLSVF